MERQDGRVSGKADVCQNGPDVRGRSTVPLSRSPRSTKEPTPSPTALQKVAHRGGGSPSAVHPASSSACALRSLPAQIDDRSAPTVSDNSRLADVMTSQPTMTSQHTSCSHSSPGNSYRDSRANGAAPNGGGDTRGDAEREEGDILGGGEGRAGACESVSPSPSLRSLYYHYMNPAPSIHSRSSSLTSIKSLAAGGVGNICGSGGIGATSPLYREQRFIEKTLSPLMSSERSSSPSKISERAPNDVQRCPPPPVGVAAMSYFFPDEFTVRGVTHNQRRRLRGNSSASPDHVLLGRPQGSPSPTCSPTATNLTTGEGPSHLVRSQSVDHQFISRLANFYPSPPPPRAPSSYGSGHSTGGAGSGGRATNITAPSRTPPHSLEVFVFDLQTTVARLNGECWCLRRELDVTREKLASSLNSVKTFWSPELKRERALRKEETTRMAQLSEQLAVILHTANLDPVTLLQHLQTAALIAKDSSSLTRSNSSFSSNSSNGSNRNNSAPSGGVAGNSCGGGVRINSAVQQQQQQFASERDSQLASRSMMTTTAMINTGNAINGGHPMSTASGLPRGSPRRNSRHSSATGQELRAEDLVERIGEGREEEEEEEEDLRPVDDERFGLRQDNEPLKSTASNNDRRHAQLLLDSVKNAQIEHGRQKMVDRCTRTEAELVKLRMQLETLQSQGADQQQHINVLRDAVHIKEQQATLLLTDLENLDRRVKEKEAELERQLKLVEVLERDRQRGEQKVEHLEEQVSMKDNTIGALQRRLTMLEDIVRERDRLPVCSTTTSTTGGSRLKQTQMANRKP